MTWAALLPIIIRDGIPAAMRIWQLINSSEPPTQEEWDRLEALSHKTYDDYLREAQERANKRLGPQ